MSAPRKGWSAALWPLLFIGALMAYQYKDFLFLLVIVAVLTASAYVVKAFVGGDSSQQRRR